MEQILIDESLRDYFFEPKPLKQHELRTIANSKDVKLFVRLSKKMLIEKKILTKNERQKLEKAIHSDDVKYYIKKISTKQFSIPAFMSSQIALRLLSLAGLVALGVSAGLIILISMLMALVGAVVYKLFFDKQELKQILLVLPYYLKGQKRLKNA